MRRFIPSSVSLAGIASGLLMACSFPSPELPLLAWFGLVPLFMTMSKRPFKSGFLAGCAFFAVVLYWLNIVMTTYGHLPLAMSLVAYLCLVAYLALYWGTATWAACRLKEKRDYPYALTLPVIWVAMEFLRSFLVTGFPWASLGYSQQPWLMVIQSADLFGVHGISYLLVFCNVAIAEVLLALRQKSARRIPIKVPLCLLVLVVANLGYGHWRMGQDGEARESSLRVGLVQGNIPQDQKWQPEYQLSTVKTYRDLSLQASQSGAQDLLVWPEAAMPFYFQDGGPLAEQVSALPAETQTALLFGSPAYRNDDGRMRYLNSAFLLLNKQELVGRSDKIHLVPFGEYVPLGQFLPFVEKLVAGIGDFSPGEVNPLPLNGHSLGVLVCYEVIFPELARDYVRQGADLLVNITNDAWFGRSSAPWQHLAMVSFRAIENRVWIARAANTGVSAFVAPSGRVVSSTALFEPAFLVDEVGLGARSTFYMQVGDSLPALFLVVVVVWLWQTRRRML